LTETAFTRTPRAELAPQWRPAWDTLDQLTGDATFVEVFAQAPKLLEFGLPLIYVKGAGCPGVLECGIVT
jgi:hypothetical protein